jgi:phytoene dehydrogenase-like protein
VDPLATIERVHDAIIIGSGLGGLCCAALLTRMGLDVVVVEQHYVAGGFAHSFRRRAFHFDSAMHYIGDVAEGGAVPRILETAGAAAVEFLPLPEDGFDVLHMPDTVFRVPVGKEAYKARLCERFPDEARGISRFVNRMDEIYEHLRRMDLPKNFGDLLTFPLRHFPIFRAAGATVEEALSAHVKDPRLKAILVAQRGDYGEHPKEASFIMHSAVMMSFLYGVGYPKGGTQALADALVRAIERQGGTVRLSSPVERITTQAGRATGVRLRSGEELQSKHVISNADLYRTLFDLLDEEAVPVALQQRVRKVRLSHSAISVFLGVDMDLRAHGFDSANHWLLPSYELRPDDPERVAQAGYYTEYGLLASSASLKDPNAGFAPEGQHTLHIAALTPFDPFSRFNGGRPGKRQEGYDTLKERVADGLIEQVENRLLPGLGDHIILREVGSPLTNVHFNWVTEGACYGPAQIPNQVGTNALGPRTPIPGLWLAGSNCGMFFGATGSLLGGVHTAGAILGRSVQDLIWPRGGHEKARAA